MGQEKERLGSGVGTHSLEHGNCLFLYGEVNITLHTYLLLSSLQLFNRSHASGFFTVKIISELCHFLTESVPPLDQLLNQDIEGLLD